MPKYLLVIVVLALVLGGFYFFLFPKTQTELIQPQVSQKQQQIANNEVKPTPTLDTSDKSINDDLTALDKDILNLQNSDASFSDQLKNF
jgi:hypothetical protein